MTILIMPMITTKAEVSKILNNMMMTILKNQDNDNEVDDDDYDDNSFVMRMTMTMMMRMMSTLSYCQRCSTSFPF